MNEKHVISPAVHIALYGEIKRFIEHCRHYSLSLCLPTV